MKDIPEFKIDKWVQRHASLAKIPLHGSNIGTLSLSKLQAFSPDQPILDNDLPLSYGPSEGSVVLRRRVAGMYSSSSAEENVLSEKNVIITPGSIMANYLALTNLVGKGDHVICQYPCFSQLWEIPRYFGAEVTLWRLRVQPQDACGESQGKGGCQWENSLGELRGMVKKETRAIVINNPNNPTGAVLSQNTLQTIAEIAAEHNITLYCDEVFRPLFHDPTVPPPPSVLNLGLSGKVPRIVVTGSVSKTIGLPGVRVGWVISNDVTFLREKIMTARDWTTISVSRLDDAVAAFALSDDVLPQLLEKNAEKCKKSIALVAEWVEKNRERVEWVPPVGAGTAFVKVKNKNGEPVQDTLFAKGLIEKTGVSVVPGEHCFGDGEDGDLKGYVRISLGLEEQQLRDGLTELESYLNGLD